MTPKDEAVIRERFNKFLEAEGFVPFGAPPPGKSYPSSHVQLLWSCFVRATLAERNKCTYPDCMKNGDERCARWLTDECKGPNKNGDPQ